MTTYDPRKYSYVQPDGTLYVMKTDGSPEALAKLGHRTEAAKEKEIFCGTYEEYQEYRKEQGWPPSEGGMPWYMRRRRG